ncbi:MAG: hypothetical protein A2234_01630 [Elusimicrobia bacterium RIFOXYA2_FULL_58_8]|nr:MAG: hypothetical protein A2285_09775 [Elusimicrobia bacterium RIFOXYA12_FULL_57_11]OGS13975.1 MAG: hypothetical protein A2234_01630 [Elusimicrobia bacterium RIFOXYA2_FULL_58_8]
MKRFLLAACAAILFFAAAAVDLGLRSRAALRQAQLHALWSATPGLKTAHYDGLLKEQLALLEKETAAGRLDRARAERQAAVLKAESDFHLAESSAKLSWIWYRTAAEKFSSPFNPWAAQARARLPAATEAWRAELAAKKIKAGDWMLE